VSRVPLSQLKETITAYHHKKDSLLEFFIEIVLLFADLCQQRNYKAIDILKIWFERDLCFELIKDAS